ncbi:MAG: hypothetical protein WBM02_08380 [bacterium]
MVIRLSLLSLIVFMAIGYKLHVSNLLPLKTFGENQYYDRADIYRKYLAAIFLWLTPFSMAAAGFFSSFGRMNRIVDRFIEVWNKLPRWFFFIVIPLLFTVWAAWTAYDLIGRVPWVFDAFNYHFQARNFALKQFYAQEPPLSELFKFPFIIIENGKWYGSVYPGYSILLALGVKLGCDWMINPILGGIGLVLMYFTAGAMFGESQARLVSFFGLISPFYRMMSSIFMAHASGIVWVVLTIWMLWLWSQKGRNVSLLVPFLAGFGMGWIYITRPQIGVITLPLFLLYTVIRVRFPGWGKLIVFILPLIASILFLAVYNQQLTGDCFINPRYHVDPGRRLGFGEDLGEPLGNGRRGGHDFSKGVQNSLLLINLWNAEMFGFGAAGVLGLLTFVIAYVLIIHWKKPLPILLGSSIVFNMILYIFYYTPSPNFGPRYFAEIIPATIFLFVFGITDISQRLMTWTKYRVKPVWLIYFHLMMIAVMFFIMLPLHRDHYGILPMKTDRGEIPEPLESAIILVPPKLYTWNMYTWNSPNLDGNIFLPLKPDVGIQRIQRAFPDRDIFCLEKKVKGAETFTLKKIAERRE